MALFRGDVPTIGRKRNFFNFSGHAWMIPIRARQRPTNRALSLAAPPEWVHPPAAIPQFLSSIFVAVILRLALGITFVERAAVTVRIAVEVAIAFA